MDQDPSTTVNVHGGEAATVGQLVEILAQHMEEARQREEARAQREEARAQMLLDLAQREEVRAQREEERAQAMGDLVQRAEVRAQEALEGLHKRDQERAHGKVKLPTPKFGGKPEEDPMRFLAKLNNALDGEDVVCPVKRTLALIGALEGAPETWALRVQDDLLKLKDWGKVREAFLGKWSSATAQEVLYRRRDALKQSGELDKYVDAYVELDAAIVGSSDTDRFHRFLSGLKDTVRQFVLMCNPENLDEAIAAARRYIHAGTWTVGGPSVAPTIAEQPTKPSMDVDAVELVVVNALSRYHQQHGGRYFGRGRRGKDSGERRTKLKEDIRCYKCDGHGHIARYCKSDKKDDKRHASEDE
jgi:hypothetical protein